MDPILYFKDYLMAVIIKAETTVKALCTPLSRMAHAGFGYRNVLAFTANSVMCAAPILCGIKFRYQNVECGSDDRAKERVRKRER